jgi:glycerate kinase
MVSGAELIIDLTHLKQRIADADLVITGEGRLDAQTLSGKAPLAVAEACKAAGKRCIAIGGALAPGVEKLLDHGVTSYFSVAPGPITLSKALELAEEFLTDTTSRIMRLL